MEKMIKVYIPVTKFAKSSGIGKATLHQIENLNRIDDVEVTTNLEEADIIHTNFYGYHYYRLIKKAKKLGKKVVVHAHSTKEDTGHSFRWWPLLLPFLAHSFLKCYKLGDVIVTPSPYSRSLLLSYPQLKNKEIYAISNGVNLDNYLENKGDFEGFYQKIQYKKGEKIVMSIGFPFERKGIIEFFEVARKMPDIKFVWLGYLTPFARPTKINIAIRKKPDNVIMPGYVDLSIIVAALHTASCFFFPTHEETEGIVVLEALASKTPLVVSDIPVYKDWLTDGLNCYKGHNVDEFVDLINKVLNSDNTELVNNGYEVVKSKTNIKVTDQMVEVYKSLLNK